MRAVICLLVAWIGIPVHALGQYKIQRIVNDQIYDLNGQVILPTASPIDGSSYGSFYGWVAEHSVTGEIFGPLLAMQNGQSPFYRYIMDGISEVRGTDLADLVDPSFAPNDIVGSESLEILVIDKTTGRFILRLTVAVYTTADPNAAQWDSFELDLRDPLDIDGDGETGAGADGIFGTGDDVIEPDGIFDTGDGTLDAPMPLDPPGPGQFSICEDDGDCGPGSETLFNPVSPQFSVGQHGQPIQFDADAGEIVPLAVYWILEDFQGGLADLDRDGQPGIGEFTGDFDSNGDGVPDSIRTDLIVPPQIGNGGWNGEYALGFANDENPETTDELMSGSLRRIGFVFDFLSDVENEFEFLCGDVNLDGAFDLLDVAPFVNLIVNGGFLIEGDINGDGTVNLTDVNGFVDKLVDGG